MSAISILCALVAGLAIAYAVEEARRMAASRLMRLVTRGQASRRIFGAVLVAVLMIVVDIGLEVIDPYDHPSAFILLWTAAGGLVLVLLGLGFLDLRELRANRDLEAARHVFRMSRDVADSVSKVDVEADGQDESD